MQDDKNNQTNVPAFYKRKLFWVLVLGSVYSNLGKLL